MSLIHQRCIKGHFLRIPFFKLVFPKTFLHFLHFLIALPVACKTQIGRLPTSLVQEAVRGRSSREVVRLVEAVARGARWRLARANDMVRRLREVVGEEGEWEEAGERGRVRRESPLDMVGSLVEWGVGLTSHQSYQEVQGRLGEEVARVALEEEQGRGAVHRARDAVLSTTREVEQVQQELEEMVAERARMVEEEEVVGTVLR